MKTLYKQFFSVSLIISLITVLLFSAGCSEDDNPVSSNNEDSNGSNLANNEAGQPIPTVAGNMDGVLVTIGYSYDTGENLPNVDVNMGFAKLGSGIDAGMVTVNDNELGKLEQSGSVYYVSPNPNNPTETLSGVNFNGSSHNWEVSGSGNISAFSGSVKSPSKFSITSPKSGSEFSSGSELQVNWSNASESNTLLHLYDKSGNSVLQQNNSDEGSYTFSSEDMSKVSGEVTLQVVKFNYSQVSSDGKSYYIIAEIIESVSFSVN